MADCRIAPLPASSRLFGIESSPVAAEFPSGPEADSDDRVFFPNPLARAWMKRRATGAGPRVLDAPVAAIIVLLLVTGVGFDVATVSNERG